MKYVGAVSEDELSFTFATFDEWFQESVQSFSIKKPGSELWKKFIAKNIDYIANPRIRLKN